MAQPLIRPDLLGRPLGDVEGVVDSALAIVDNPAGHPEGLYYQARGVLHVVQYLRGRAVLIEGLPSPPRTLDDVGYLRLVMYQALSRSDAAGDPFRDRVEATAMWMMLGYVLGYRNDSPLAQIATRTAA